MAQNNQKVSKVIAWYMMVICTIALLCIFYLFFTNLEWFKESAINDSDLMKSANYRIFIYTAHLSNLKRLLGIISGASIAFLGLGVCFHAISTSTSLELNKIGKIVSYSPGLIALFLGCVLIYMSINSKDTMSLEQAD